MSISAHAMMMIRQPLRHVDNESLTLLVLFDVVFIFLDVLMNEFGSFKLFCYDKCLLHGLHPCVAVIKRSGTTREFDGVYPREPFVRTAQQAADNLVTLVEVENDSVLRDLTRRSLLRNAGYEYLMTSSPDLRGIDVALLYQPFSFRPVCYDYLDVTPLEDMRPTRDILYVQGETVGGDTLHVFVVHAPSRFGGEKVTRPNRRVVMERLIGAIQLLPPDAKVIVAGDFNDYADSPSLLYLEEHALHNVTKGVVGSHGAQGTYRYEGRWESIDHILISPALLGFVEQVYINDAPFLLEEDKKYGGLKPFRTYNGYRYQRGFSDHLPLVVRFLFKS